MRKSVVVLYFMCFLKIVSTFLYLSAPTFNCYFLTIVALPVCLAGAYNPSIVRLCVITVMLTIAIWLCGIVLSFLGIKFAKARKWSIIVFTIATIVDLLTVFISPNNTVRITCSIVSILTLFVCIFCLSRNWNEAID